MTPEEITTEPADRTALYWPERKDRCARLVIRDDRAAELDPSDHPADAHWWAPNTDDGSATWEDLQSMMGEDFAYRQDNAVVFSMPTSDQPANLPADRIGVIVSDAQRAALRMLLSMVDLDEVADGLIAKLPAILFAQETAAELLAAADPTLPVDSTKEG
jgi:hypothetical protein